MAKILNLDDFKTQRELVLGGKSRKVTSMTVEEFINAADFDAKFKEATGSDQINLLIDMIIGHVSDTERKELTGLEIGQLSALLNFIRGQEAPDAAVVPVDAGAEVAKN